MHHVPSPIPRAARILTLFGLLAAVACQEGPVTAPRAAPRHVSMSLSATSDTAVVSDVTYGMLHGSVRFWNPVIAATANGSFSSDSAWVKPGASVRMTANWQIGPVTNVGYCPDCIIEVYAAWLPNAPANGATPINTGLWMGITNYLNPNPGAGGTYNWTTHAPTVDGKYYVGSGSTLDYIFQPGAQGGTGSPTGGPSNQHAASFLIVADGTPPVVTYTGNAGAYSVDQTIAISCTATDALSGVVSNTCADVDGPAYSFSLGTNTYSAQATDRAGNVGTGTTSFTVNVTAAGLCNLVTEWAKNDGLANSLCVKLTHGDVQPFLNELSAQSGKGISTDNAAVLKRLASTLQ